MPKITDYTMATVRGTQQLKPLEQVPEQWRTAVAAALEE